MFNTDNEQFLKNVTVLLETPVNPLWSRTDRELLFLSRGVIRGVKRVIIPVPNVGFPAGLCRGLRIVALLRCLS